MKKIWIFAILSIFFSSCPVMEDLGGHVVLKIQNLSSQTLTFDMTYNNTSRFHYDHLEFDGVANICGPGYHDDLQSPYQFLIEECKNKHLVVTSLYGDTLANWNDSSMVFNDQTYWLVQPNEDGYTCTLQLTDEVLKLK